MPDKTLTDMSDAELATRADALAKQRTEVRLAQNAVQAEIDLRRALSSMSQETRRIVQVRLGGSTTPEGEARR